MRIGVILPQLEIGSNPATNRAFTETAANLGFRPILAYDHILGADASNRPDWTDSTNTALFHEPFVRFGFLATIAPEMELVIGVIVLASGNPSWSLSTRRKSIFSQAASSG